VEWGGKGTALVSKKFVVRSVKGVVGKGGMPLSGNGDKEEGREGWGRY